MAFSLHQYLFRFPSMLKLNLIPVLKSMRAWHRFPRGRHFPNEIVWREVVSFILALQCSFFAQRDAPKLEIFLHLPLFTQSRHAPGMVIACVESEAHGSLPYIILACSLFPCTLFCFCKLKCTEMKYRAISISKRYIVTPVRLNFNLFIPPFSTTKTPTKQNIFLLFRMSRKAEGKMQQY